METRKQKELTEQEKNLVKHYSGKMTLADLAKKLGWNYTNLSSALKQQRIPFVTKKAPRKPAVEKDANAMNKEKAEDGKTKLLTDKHLKEWFENGTI